MRPDMFKVVVERRRRMEGLPRKGRELPDDALSSSQGMRRPHIVGWGGKRLNENLAPLRRFLGRQVGRPWTKVFADICEQLQPGTTVQLHVRAHIEDFVAVKPRWRYTTSYPWPPAEDGTRVKIRRAQIWHQPLYVDPRDGI